MDIDQAKARSAGVKMAEAAGAPRTAAVIANKNACYHDIFNSAVDEIGHGPFVEALKQGPRHWARTALNLMPNLGGHGTGLAETLVASADPTAAKDGDAICKFELYEGAAVSGIVRINQTGDYRNLFVKNTYDFNPADQGIAVGTKMQFFFGIEDDVLIGLNGAPERFTFDPNSKLVAYYASWGIAGGQQFALQDQPGAAS